MKKSNESKLNIVHRLLNSTLKFKKEIHDNRPKSPVYKFNYELPKSFLKAVDKVRITSGYDILPRFRHRSASPTIQPKTSSPSSPSLSSSSYDSNNSHQTRPRNFRSSSTNDIDRVCTKKIQFRRTPRGHVHRQQTTTPRLFPPRPRFCMMVNPNFMMMNRPRRPLNILPIRSPVSMQRQPIFQLRFR